jgi:hypothetical protein
MSAYDLGSKKLIKIVSGFNVELVQPPPPSSSSSSSSPLIHSEDEVSIVVKTNNSIDIDVRAKLFQVNVDADSILTLINVLLSYSGSSGTCDDINDDDNDDNISLPKQTLKTLMWLQEHINNTTDSSGEMDGGTFTAIIDLIKKVIVCMTIILILILMLYF